MDVRAGAIDIGNGVRIIYTLWGDHDPVGLIEYHPCEPGGTCRNPRTECGGAVLFDLPGVREAFPDRAVWTVNSLDPLDLSPSLLCGCCGHHGWIRGGRWVPV